MAYLHLQLKGETPSNGLFPQSNEKRTLFAMCYICSDNRCSSNSTIVQKGKNSNILLIVNLND